MNNHPPTHSVVVGYILWIFGFIGAHRFYFGKPISGTLWFFTAGLFLIGWIIDLFLIAGMARRADLRYQAGPIDYALAWVFLTFLGVFGIHRFYMGKWITGIIYLLSGGLIGLGVLYDFWTLNGQVSEMNHHRLQGGGFGCFVSFGLKSFAHDVGSLHYSPSPPESSTASTNASPVGETLLAQSHPTAANTCSKRQNLKDSPDGEGFRPIVVTKRLRTSSPGSTSGGWTTSSSSTMT